MNRPFQAWQAAVKKLQSSFETVGGQDKPIRNAYERLQFGIVHVRTDGERVLVATHSGKDDQKESYAFRVDEQGGIAWEETSIV